MSTLSGFPEFLPAERNVERLVIEKLSRVFELHGFASIQTRAVEPMDQLLRKGEIDKEVYVLRRLHDADGDAGIGLHFDLTVPFARYVVENAGKLNFPFRRYQIQKVWRGERPQHGRFREFTQADIDIVDKAELAFHFDVEVASVMAQALAALPLPTVTIQVNNRKILEGFYRGLGIDDPLAVMQVIDKLDKLPPAQVRDMLIEHSLSAQQADACLNLAAINTASTQVASDSAADLSFIQRVRDLAVSHELLEEGLEELGRVVSGASGAEGVRVIADLRIARGLDYYTGTVFETTMSGYEHLGSICSGGRYENLASDGKNTYPGVGISLGVSRVLVPLVADGLSSDRSVPSAVLIALNNENSWEESSFVAQKLRARNIPCEVAPRAQKFGKQIRFAQRRGIPYVWFIGTENDTATYPDLEEKLASIDHQVKDIRSGEQQTADFNAWLPPQEDLYPRIKE